MFAIKRMREHSGLSQQETADALGITLRRYGNWEREDREINLRDAVRLADLFNCTLDELAGRTWPKGAATYGDPKQQRLNENWERLSDSARDHVLEDSEAQLALGRTMQGAYASEESA